MTCILKFARQGKLYIPGSGSCLRQTSRLLRAGSLTGESRTGGVSEALTAWSLESCRGHAAACSLCSLQVLNNTCFLLVFMSLILS